MLFCPGAPCNVQRWLWLCEIEDNVLLFEHKLAFKDLDLLGVLDVLGCIVAAGGGRGFIGEAGCGDLCRPPWPVMAPRASNGGRAQDRTSDQQLLPRPGPARAQQLQEGQGCGDQGGASEEQAGVKSEGETSGGGGTR